MNNRSYANSSDDDADEVGDWDHPWDSSHPYSIPVATDASHDVASPLSTGTGTPLVSIMSLNDNKAGMQGLDKEHINQIIYEASKGSRYYESEMHKEQRIQQRIDAQTRQLNKLTQQQKLAGRAKADKLLKALEESRNLSRVIVHVDMDAFFAAVEILDNPELRDRPMAVGCDSMLSTSNYVARRFGVRAAMPGFIARKLCPDVVIVSPNFNKYTAVSEQVRAVFCLYDPGFSPMSLDEAYLDFTKHLEQRRSMSEEERTHWGYDNPELVCHCSATEGSNNATQRCTSCGKPFGIRKKMVFGTSAEDAVNEMRYRIYQKTHLTASAGIAANTMLAKVCSDRNKPNGQFALPATREAILEFIHDLPIRKICGIGKVTEKMLAALGIVNCSHLYEHRDTLACLYSDLAFEHFMSIYLGIGSTHVERDGERKSMSVERTFSEIAKPCDMYEMCHKLAEMLAEDLHGERLMGKTLTLKIKTVSFKVFTRAHTLAQPTNDVERIYKAASELLRGQIAAYFPKRLRLRLLGIRMSSLCADTPRAGTLTSVLLRHCKGQENGPPKEAAASNCGKNDSWTVDHIQNIFKILPTDIPLEAGTHSEELDVCDSSVMETFNSSSVVEETDSGDVMTGTSGSENGKVVCPVCERLLTADPADISQHIDECLNRSAIRDMLAHDNNVSHESSRNLTVDRKLEAGTRSKDARLEPCDTNTVERLETFISSSAVEETESDDFSFAVMTGTSGSENGKIVCPVCERSLTADQVNISQHIDECLNRTAIRDILAHDKTSLTRTSACGSKELVVSKASKRKWTDADDVRPLDKFVVKTVKHNFKTIEQHL